MIAAVYARKSTDQNLPEVEKSVTRQVEHATAYAMRKGWTVDPTHVYQDDGISGAEFVKRPGFLRLMNALKPKPAFQVLIMSEESRLGREQIETAYALKQIMDAGVRVFFYLEDRERTLDSAMDKVMLSLTNFAAEMEREKARQRTHDALLRKAKACHVPGGAVYGYDNVEVLSSTPGSDGKMTRQHVIRQINAEQAAIILRIFQAYASGLGLTRIAKTLNAERVPPPRKDSNGWAPTAIREMLHRPLYRGEIVWNRSEKVSRGGTKTQRQRPETDWVRLAAPALRIVPEDLWQTVRARLERNAQAFPRTREGGRLLGRPSGRDLASPYLLSGLGRCASCGGTFIAMTRAHGKGRAHFYGCGYNYKRGTTICANSVQVRQELLDQAVLQAVTERLDERVLERALELTVARLREGREEQVDRRAQIEQELALVETQERRLVEAIKCGEAVEPLVVALKAEGERKAVLTKELSTVTEVTKVVSLDAERLKRDLKARAVDVRGLLSRQTPQARQMLRKLLVDRLDFVPVEEGGRRGYWFTGQGTYARLVGEALPLTVVAPYLKALRRSSVQPSS